MTGLLYERRGAAGWVTLDRPEAMNAVTPGMLEDLDAALSDIADDNAVRALVITGAGPAFCAGADLKEVEAALAGDPARAMAFVRAAQRVFGRIADLPKPTIAAVNGLTLAGGLEIVLCCDLVIAAEGAKIGDAHANFGVLPGGGGSARLPLRVGAARAKEMFFTGAAFPAESFVPDLVNRVVPGAALAGEVEKLVAAIATKSALVLRRLKALADGALAQPLPTALAAELLAFESHLHSADLREGLMAFKEKRKPVFVGS
jgi:enoyl-CoA hydratase/carnithine racemase